MTARGLPVEAGDRPMIDLLMPARSERLGSVPATAPPVVYPASVESGAHAIATPRAPDYVPVEEAAARLALTPMALRARCRRAARREGRRVVAHLGADVIAYKFGRSWRVHFPKCAT
jgi:hypothetical protein